jgi:hypothetical protein
VSIEERIIKVVEEPLGLWAVQRNKRELRAIALEVNKLEDRIKRLEEALHRIANTDYRGHRSTESQIAFQVLTEAKP